MKRSVLFVISLLLLQSVVVADDNAGAFLDKGFGARPHALGGAFVGLANDPTALVYNAAGLAQIQNIMIDSMFTRLYGEVSQTYVGGVVPADEKSAFGFAYFNTGVDGIQSTTWDGNRGTNLNDDFTYGAYTLMLGYGTRIMPSLAVGINTKLVNESLQDSKASGFGADVGLLYTPMDNLNIGFSIQNLLQPRMTWDKNAAGGSSEAADTMPMQYALGASYRILDLTILADTVLRNNRDMQYRIGAEYVYDKMVALRAGLNNGAMTCGLGLEYGGLIFNYAYMNSPDEILESNQAFSVGFKFGNQEKVQKQAEKPSGAPVELKVLSASVIKPMANDLTFSDIQMHWGRQAVENMSGLGIVSGRPDGRFDPNGLIKKAEAAKMVLLAYKLKSQAGSAEFALKLNDSFKVEKGEQVEAKFEIVNEFGALVKTISNPLDINKKEQHLVWDGTDSEGRVVQDGSYTARLVIRKADGEIKEEKAVKVESKSINVALKSKTDTEFADIKAAHWASGIVDESVKMGIISGESELIFNANRNYTKLDMALTLAKALKLEGYTSKDNAEIPFRDAATIPQSDYDLMKVYISTLGAGGDQNGMFHPYKNLSRVEAAVMLGRYLNTNKVLEYRANLLSHQEEVAAAQPVQQQPVVKVINAGLIVDVAKLADGKILFTGTAANFKAIKLNGKDVYVKPSDGKFYEKIAYTKNKPLAVTIIDKGGKTMELNLIVADTKVILQGKSDKTMQITVNNKSINVADTGKFNSDVSNKFSFTVKSSFRTSDLAGL